MKGQFQLTKEEKTVPETKIEKVEYKTQTSLTDPTLLLLRILLPNLLFIEVRNNNYYYKSVFKILYDLF